MGSKSKPPPAPDYVGAAREQAESSKEVTNMQTYANRPNQQTPWGGTTWTPEAFTDPATGQQVTRWNQEMTLDPSAQEALDSQLAVQTGRSQAAQGLLPRVTDEIADSWDYSRFSPRAGIPGTPDLDTSAPGQTTQAMSEGEFASERQRLENAAFERMRPEFGFRDEALRTRLYNQGIDPDSDAGKRATQQEADLQARERWNALQAGGEEQARLQAMKLAREGQAFGQDVAAQGAGNAALQSQQGADITGANFQNTERQQQIVEEMQRRGMSLNEINALLTGQQVQTPGMPGFTTAQRADPAQYLSAAQMEGQHDLDVFNAQQAGRMGFMSGLFGLGSSYLGRA